MKKIQQETQKKFKLPKSFTTVTKASKILALTMFVTLPFIGFYFGINYCQLNILNKEQKKTQNYNSQNHLIKYQQSRLLREWIDLLENEDFYQKSIYKFRDDPTSAWDSIFWFSQDDWLIFMQSSDVTTIGVLYPNAINELIHEESYTKKIIDSFENYMKNKGLNKSVKNSSTSFTESEFTDYILSYEKSESRCQLRVNSDMNQEEYDFRKNIDDLDERYSITISCSEGTYQKNYKYQLPFLKAINNKDLLIYKVKQYGSFAYVGVSSTGLRGGMHYILFNNNGTWKQIDKGQESSPCSLWDKYDIPDEIHTYKSCIEY